MPTNNTLQRWLVILLSIASMLTVGACTTMVLQKYPAPNTNKFEASKEVEGVSAIAQAILDEKEGEQYFGVNLIEKEILAIYLGVKNQHSSTTFILLAESVHVSEAENEGSSMLGPDHDSKAAAEALTTIGGSVSMLIVPVFAPIFVISGTQQLSDSVIIKENYESNRFRTTTLEPGEAAGGFLFFPWGKLKNLDKAHLCFDLVNPLKAQSLSSCFSVNLRRKENG